MNQILIPAFPAVTIGIIVFFLGAFVTWNTFWQSGVQPILGRGFREGEDQPDAVPVIVLGHDVWKDRYGSMGSTLTRRARLSTVPRLPSAQGPVAIRSPLTSAMRC